MRRQTESSQKRHAKSSLDESGSYGLWHELAAEGLGPLWRGTDERWPAPEVLAIFAVLGTWAGAKLPEGAGPDLPPDAPGGPDEPPEPPAPVDGGPPGRPEAFSRGDHPELAARLLAELSAALGGPVVSDEGELWGYSHGLGRWRALATHDCERRVAAYAGLPCLRADDPAPLFLRYPDILGAISTARAMSRRPEFFSSAPMGICFANGFLRMDEQGARLEPHSSEHRARHALPVAYVAGAPAPRWERYWSEVFDGLPVEDQAERYQLVQEFVGACLLGAATRYQSCLVLLGEGANGKSVCLDVVAAMFPPGSVTHVAPQEWAADYKVSMLRRGLLNAVSELPERDILEADRFKAVVTGDPITGREPYCPAFSFRPRCGHLFAANKLPPFKDRSRGFLRRFLVVPFERTFAPGSADIKLAEKIIRDELSGVVCWALDGAQRLLARGRYGASRASEGQKEEWQRSNDSPLAFLAHCAQDVIKPLGVVPEQWRTVPYVRAEEFYTAYREWCRRSGFLPVNLTAFGSSVRAAVAHKRTNAGVVYFCRISDPYSLRSEMAAQQEFAIAN